jgi:hypothetical protein
VRAAFSLRVARRRGFAGPVDGGAAQGHRGRCFSCALRALPGRTIFFPRRAAPGTMSSAAVLARHEILPVEHQCEVLVAVSRVTHKYTVSTVSV